METRDDKTNSKKILGSARIAGVGMIYQQAISFASGLLIARVIGAADYGVVNLARNLVNVLLIFTRLGLDLGLQRHLGSATDAQVLQRRLAQLVRLRRIAAIAALTIVVISAVGGARLLEAYVFKVAGFEKIFLATAIALPFLTDLTVLGGAYRGVLKVAPAVMAEFVILPTVRLALVLVLFALGLRLWAVVIATTMAGVLASGFLYLRSRLDLAPNSRQHPGSPVRDRSAAGQGVGSVIRFSVVLAAAMGVTALTRTLDTFALGYFKTPAMVGQYSLAQMMMTLAALFGAAIGQTSGSMIARHHAIADVDGMQRVMRKQARWIMMATAPVCVALACWGESIIRVFGPSFVISPLVIGTMAVTQLAVSVLAPSGYALSMTGRHKEEFGLLVIGLAITALGCLLLVPSFDQLGAAIATALALLVVNVVRLLYVHRVFRIHALDWELARIFIISALLAAAVKTISGLSGESGHLGIVVLAVSAYGILQFWLSWSLFLDAQERLAVQSYLTQLVNNGRRKT
jgi:O-antigen/teichoic acid export membrane protein